jgi:predicted PP-loop superfamily ATPase
MDAEVLTRLLDETRRRLNLTRGAPPQVQRVLEHPEGQLHAIVPDRAEKSQCIGPGGKIVAELAQRIGKDVAFHGSDELALRQVRLRASKSRIHEIKERVESENQSLLTVFERLIDLEIAFPVQSVHDYEAYHKNGEVAASYSGGVDSSAALVILERAQVDCKAYTVSPDPRILPPPDIDAIREFCRQIRLDCQIIHAPNLTQDIMNRAKEGLIHPCGECHATIMGKVIEEATSNGHHMIVTGQSLPTGRQAIQELGGIIQIHLPALLSLTKYRMKEILKKRGFPPHRERFGCNFLSRLHNDGWSMIGPSVYRILRELEAGILTSGESLRLIKSVAKQSMKSKK